MNPLSRDPIIQGFLSVFNPQVIDGIFYFFNELDKYEAKQRYDDNRRRFLEQALRLYEQGEMSKDQLKVVIDLLPEKTIEVQATPVRPSPADPKSEIDLESLLNKIMNQ
ncbi:hypothetical protein [Microcystis sp. M169S2]|uniref:hypothetical protein n=1 Tax=Microcystis sp. M169S2 TaxID=2771157 RepID=UPI0025911ACC|nr:hypothetical protein [Microcystis sp. M169S2]MCA2720195.1 hypothetical protein [Microcystis sp. M169S2]